MWKKSFSRHNLVKTIILLHNTTKKKFLMFFFYEKKKFDLKFAKKIISVMRKCMPPRYQLVSA